MQYADPLMDILDYEQEIPHRLFREHCQQTSNGYIKNLSRLGRNLKDVIIIDNSPISYIRHQANSLPITSWYDDNADVELLNFIPVLEMINKFNDVRAIIPQIVFNDKLSFPHFNRLVREQQNGTAPSNTDIIKNIAPQTTQHKTALEKHRAKSNSHNEPVTDEKPKVVKIEKKISIPLTNHYKELSKIITKMTNTTKNFNTYRESNSKNWIDGYQKSKVISKPPIIGTTLFTPKVQKKENKEKEKVSTPKDSSTSSSMFKFTGIKMRPKEASKPYTNLLRLSMNTKEEIMKENVETKHVPLVTPKKPLLINNLMKDFRSNSHLGVIKGMSTSTEEIKLDATKNSPKHMSISKKLEQKNITPEITKSNPKDKYDKKSTLSIESDIRNYIFKKKL